MRHNMLVSGSGGGSPVYFQQDLSSTERDVANWDGPWPQLGGVQNGSIVSAPRTTGSNTGVTLGCLQSDSYTGNSSARVRLSRTILDTPQTRINVGDVFNITSGVYWDDDRTSFGDRTEAFMWHRVLLLDTVQSTDDFGFSDPNGGADLVVSETTTRTSYLEVGAVDEDFTIPSGYDKGIHIQVWYLTRESPTVPGNFRGIVISDCTLTKVS